MTPVVQRRAPPSSSSDDDSFIKLEADTSKPSKNAVWGPTINLTIPGSSVPTGGLITKSVSASHITLKSESASAAAASLTNSDIPSLLRSANRKPAELKNKGLWLDLSAPPSEHKEKTSAGLFYKPAVTQTGLPPATQTIPIVTQTGLPPATQTIPTVTQTIPTITGTIPTQTGTIPTITGTIPTQTGTTPTSNQSVPVVPSESSEFFDAPSRKLGVALTSPLSEDIGSTDVRRKSSGRSSTGKSPLRRTSSNDPAILRRSIGRSPTAQT